MRKWIAALLGIAIAGGGTARPLFAEVRTFSTDLTIAVWNDSTSSWEERVVSAPVVAEVEMISESPEKLHWRVRAIEGVDQPLSSRVTVTEPKGTSIKLNHWRVVRGNPYRQPQDTAVDHALHVDLVDYFSKEELDAAWNAYDAMDLDTTYVQNRSEIYSAGVYGAGQVVTNVQADWQVVVRDKKREPAPSSMRVVRARYDYVLDGGDVLYHFTGGYIDHYIGDATTPGCNNIYVHRAEFDRVEVKVRIVEETPEVPPTIDLAPPEPPTKLKKKGPSFKLEAFTGIARIGDQGVLFEGGRGVFYPWNPHFGLSAKVFAFQTPPMVHPSEYGFGPFDGMINRWGVGGGPYFEVGPIKSFTHFGRQRFEGEWEPGYFWEEEFTLHFNGGSGLNPTFETLIFHLPKYDYLWARERLKLDVGHWGPSLDKYAELVYADVLRIGVEGVLHGDQQMLWSPDEAGYYYSQGDALVEYYHRFDTWWIDGISLVGLGGYSSFGWVASLEISYLIHDAWRR